eukprot:m.358787 g.358787  ORF g.358787 m.358787 type:complete len:1200 (+) comp18288_c0_seq1:276-3875(+)
MPLCGDKRTVFPKTEQRNVAAVPYNRNDPTSRGDPCTPEHFYRDNRVITSKYTLLTFIPINFFEQFRRVANFYFLVMMLLNFIPGVAILSPITSILPLSFVISVTAIKQGYEDYRRHVADDEINSQVTRILCDDGQEYNTSYADVRVGDIVKVLDDEEFPCDLVLLSSSLPSHDCYITTANLDGETTFKLRACPRLTETSTEGAALASLNIKVRSAAPNPHLYELDAQMTSATPGALSVTESISVKNLLPKGAKLKNTEWVYGLALFTGKDTKTALNEPKGRLKFSSVETKLNHFLIFYLLWLILICSISVAQKNAMAIAEFWPIMEAPRSEMTPSERRGQSAKDWMSFMLLYNWVIPISLYVTLELQKLAGSLLIKWDASMYDPELKEYALARTSDLMEEVGQIQYVFADKTGTLTENDMVFKRCNVAGQPLLIQGDYEELKLGSAPQPSHGSLAAAGPVSTETNVAAASAALSPSPSVSGVPGTSSPKEFAKTQKFHEFFLALGLCNTIQIEEGAIAHGSGVDRERKLTSESPDEIALMKAVEMQQVGITLETRSEQSITLNIHGVSKTFEVIHMLEFTSARARMSVLVRSPEGRYLLYSKGADSAIFERALAYEDNPAAEEKELAEKLQVQLDDYSTMGLRTLVVTVREFDSAFMDEFLPRLKQAKEAVEDRKGKLAAVYAELEVHLKLLGVTAVEDRLQDGVPEAMSLIRQAGINLWVLTGDKVQTAVNISLSAGHFTANTQQIKLINIVESEECGSKLKAAIQHLEQNPWRSHSVTSRYGTLDSDASVQRHHSVARKCDGVAMIMDGKTLAVALKDHSDTFRELASHCKAVLCCRLSPVQKAQVVKLIKTNTDTAADQSWLQRLLHPTPPPTTLAIGDGANDVAMIREAHIGVGILGKEGRQAARSSDYSFGKFRFLARLLLVHGHYSYWRIAYTVQYFFYKNLTYILPVLYYGTVSLFSAQPLYEQWLLTFWNVIFTSLPVLIFGIFEKDIEEEHLMKHPSLYNIYIGNKVLTWKQFAKWNITGLWHGTVAYYFIVYGMDAGRPQYSLWWMSTGIYSFVMLVVTFKIASDMRNWTYISHICTWGSVVAFVAFNLLYMGVVEIFGASSTTGGIYWVCYNLWGSFTFWQMLFVAIVLAMLPDYCYGIYKRFCAPSESQALQARIWAGHKTIPGCIYWSRDEREAGEPIIPLNDNV